MQYCTRCIIPDTRPHIEFDSSGVCNACRAGEYKREIDWERRQQTFERIVEEAKGATSGYDCLIPVSGGKDSTWQVVKCLEYGLRPLTVTWRPPGRTAVGWRNLENLISLGVDHIDYTISPRVEREFTYQALLRYGSPAIPMHMAIFGIPLTLAVRYRIPLIIWGENSALEYGGTDSDIRGVELDEVWLSKYGVTHGTQADHWVSEKLSEKDLAPYFGPTTEELTQAKVRAIFLGCFFPWDVETSHAVACEHGFQSRSEGPKTGLYDYADIDDDFISVHHFLKWYKFGFTRIFDNLSLEIRAGRMTRAEAISAVRSRGLELPAEDIERFVAFLGISETQFFEAIEKFRNLEIWHRDGGRWKIRDFLIDDWEWSR